MKRCISFVLALCLLAVAALADDKDKSTLYEKKGDKERIYNLPYDEAWSAAIEAAKEHFALDQLHKEEGVFTFVSGAGFTTHGFNVNVAFMKESETRTRIKLSFHKRKAQLYSWGAGDHIAEKFFKEMDKKITEKRAAVK